MNVGDEVVILSKAKAGETGIIEKFLKGRVTYVTLRMPDNSLFFTLIDKVELVIPAKLDENRVRSINATA